MIQDFDHFGINHAVVALSREMAPKARINREVGDILFFGAPSLSDTDRAGLADFACRKNWKLIVASFDPANPHAGPTGFDVVITDGLTQSTGLRGGRLWKKDRKSAAILIFEEISAVIKMDAKGQLLVNEMRGPFHDQGFDIARDALLDQAARKPGRAPIIAWIGTLMAVHDTKAFARTFEVAE